MGNLRGSGRIKFVSFSGVDGAGKSTQIERLCQCANEIGLRVRVLRFWDDVARLTRIRERTGHKVFRGDKGIGSPEAPINRRDKNVGGWPMTCLRFFLYLVDAISLRIVVRKALSGGADFIVFDRYTYDELANLDLAGPLTRAYAGLIMHIIPKPDVSFVLDADPEAARARKPEYPIEFIHANRRAYMELDRIFGGFTIIAPMGIESAHQEVLKSTFRIPPFETPAAEDCPFGLSPETRETNAWRT
jgi:thymidylate kinase